MFQRFHKSLFSKIDCRMYFIIKRIQKVKKIANQIKDKFFENLMSEDDYYIFFCRFVYFIILMMIKTK